MCELTSTGRNGCRFCAIIGGEREEESIVYEDEQVLMLRNKRPRVKEHLLVIPKQHTEDPMCLDWGPVLLVAVEWARQHLYPEGYRLLLNFGEHGGQHERHLHLHLMGGEYVKF